MNTRHSILVLLCGMLLNSPLDAEDWPQFRGPNRDAVWNESGTLQVFPSEGLKVRWRATIGPGFSSEEVPGAVERIVDTYLGLRQANESFLMAYRRVGAQPFKLSGLARQQITVCFTTTRKDLTTSAALVKPQRYERFANRT